MSREEIILKNLKTLREKNKFSQQNIAEYLGLDQIAISKIEKGERQVTVDMLEKLACLYGITASDFMTEDISVKSSRVFRLKTSVEDLKAISAINKIALNSVFMEKILRR